MSTLNKIHRPLEPQIYERSIILFVTLLAICLLARLTEGNDVGETTLSEWTRAYKFLDDKSTITQTGGISGIYRSYTLTGTFRLSVDFEAGTSFFNIVDASADYSDYPQGRTEKRVSYSIDPNEVFDMTELDGRIMDGNAIQFEGMADDGSSIQITLTLTDDNISLKGDTVPPPGSADFFVYTLNAIAEPKYEYGGGSGTSDDPYRIYTAEQMNAIGANSIDWNNHFRLMADIDLSKFDGKDGRPAFNIIGTSLDSFTGVFDGNNLTISHLIVRGHEYLGLFGIINDPNAEVKNLGLINPNLYTGGFGSVGALTGRLENGLLNNCYTLGGRAWGDYVGGLVGWNSYGKVMNCYSISNIIGMNMCAGGLVGQNHGEINNCYSSCTVSGYHMVGGLAGANDGTIKNSYSISNISSHGNSVGGLVGHNGGFFGGDGSIVINCYSVGSVSGGAIVGGLIGLFAGGTMKGCYSACSVSGEQLCGGLVGRNSSGNISTSFWNIQTSGLSNMCGIQNINAAGCDDSFGKTTAEMQMAGTFLDAGWDFVGETTNGNDDVWLIDENKDYPHLYWEMHQVKYSGGTGTVSDPYQIATAADLILLGGSPQDYNKHFILTADIDLDPNLQGGKIFDKSVIASDTYTGSEFDGINFTGVFDGNGHVISHMTIHGMGYLGLFGKVASGSKIKYLGVVDVNITGEVDANIIASDIFVGGLIGWNFGDVLQCFITGRVNGNDLVGGLVGVNDGSVINCYNMCNVSGNDYVGGLVGDNGGSISTSYNRGSVSGRDSVGGLVGDNIFGNIVSSYSSGSVSGNDDVGGLVGRNESFVSTGRVNSSFWDIQTSGQASSGVGTDLTTTEMQTASTFLDDGWDFVGETANGTEDIWWILEGQDYPRLWWENDNN